MGSVLRQRRWDLASGKVRARLDWTANGSHLGIRPWWVDNGPTLHLFGWVGVGSPDAGGALVRSRNSWNRIGTA